MSAAATDPVISVLIVSYNTREMTLACLASLRAQTRTPHEVILVDNASTDGSAAAVATAFPEVQLLAETTNHGFARANNLAAGHSRGEYLLLLNPDTLVLDGAIDKLLAFARERPAAQIWGGRTLYGDGSLNATSCWRRMTLWSLACRTSGLANLFPRSEIFNAEAYGGWARDSVRAVDIVTGCLFLIRRDFWNRLGGFDSAFFMYGEESDLCLRARALGADPHITPEATIVHYVGASSSLRSDKTARVLAGQVSLIDRHFPRWQRPIARGVLELWPLSRAVGLSAATLVRPRLAANRDTWREVWRRRADWRPGYLSVSAPMAVPPAPDAQPSPAAPRPAGQHKLGRRDKLLRLIGGVLDPRAWGHGLKLINYYNYSHVQPLRKIRLGPNPAISPTASFANPERIEIGARVHVGARCTLWAGPGHGRIRLGDDVLFGPDVLVTAANYRFNDGEPVSDQAMDEADVVIGNDVWLGAKAIVLPGSRIGDGAIIGAGAVVRGEIPPMTVAVGVPARVLAARTICPPQKPD